MGVSCFIYQIKICTALIFHFSTYYNLHILEITLTPKNLHISVQRRHTCGPGSPRSPFEPAKPGRP